MDLNVVKLTNFETEESSQEFLNKVNSKLLLDLSKSQIVENDEWIEMVEFSLPHLEKALTKEIKNIVTEEEIIKIELIKKVTVESVKHLSKNVNFVDRFNQKSGEVIPKKILNAYKEETFITYENRFLFSLIKLIEDYMYLREKDQETEYKGKNEKKANYHAEANYKKEKIKVNVEYISEKQIGVSKSSGTAERIQQIKKKIKKRYPFLDPREHWYCGYELTKKGDLKQPGQFASNETVTVRGPKGEFKNVRSLGPVRSKSQVEISKTDSFRLGIKPPVRESGDLAGTPGVELVGPKGTLALPEGAIVALRHIHMTPEQAMAMGVKDKDVVEVETFGERSGVFGDVLVRVSDKFSLEMHVDIDEANACALKNNDYVILRKKN